MMRCLMIGMLGCALALSVAACEDEADDERDGAGDADGDADADGDTDGDGDGDADADGDADGDTDADGDADADGDGDADEPGLCAMNQGYPCACDQNQCLDGSTCAVMPGSTKTTGICARACPGDQDDLCLDTNGYGIPDVGGTCAFMGAGDTEPSLCAVLCEYEGETGPCPTGTVCTPQGGWSACI